MLKCSVECRHWTLVRRLGDYFCMWLYWLFLHIIMTTIQEDNIHTRWRTVIDVETSQLTLERVTLTPAKEVTYATRTLWLPLKSKPGLELIVFDFGLNLNYFLHAWKCSPLYMAIFATPSPIPWQRLSPGHCFSLRFVLQRSKGVLT